MLDRAINYSIFRTFYNQIAALETYVEVFILSVALFGLLMTSNEVRNLKIN